MKRSPTDNRGPLLLIYDGECEFCQAWLNWLHRKLQITALSFHTTDLAQYGLTQEQCAKEVILITPDGNLAGSDAIVRLLHLRGNRLASQAIGSLGPIARLGYRWVASHRSSFLIKTWTKFLNHYCA